MDNCCAKDKSNKEAGSRDSKSNTQFTSKISKKELEDLYYSLVQNNQDLKKKLHQQADELKVLTTKLNRMTAAYNTFVGRQSKDSQSDSSKTAIKEQKDLIAELEKSNAELREQVKQLTMKLCTTKQFLQGGPYSQLQAKFRAPPPRSAPSHRCIKEEDTPARKAGNHPLSARVRGIPRSNNYQYNPYNGRREFIGKNKAEERSKAHLATIREQENHKELRKVANKKSWQSSWSSVVVKNSPRNPQLDNQRQPITIYRNAKLEPRIKSAQRKNRVNTRGVSPYINNKEIGQKPETRPLRGLSPKRNNREIGQKAERRPLSPTKETAAENKDEEAKQTHVEKSTNDAECEFELIKETCDKETSVKLGPDEAEMSDTRGSSKCCEENRCKTLMEELQQEIAFLKTELSKTHDEYADRIVRLEEEVARGRDDNVRVRGQKDRGAQKHDERVKELKARMRDMRWQIGELTTQLTLEKSRVSELETQLRASEIARDIARALEHKLSQDLAKHPATTEEPRSESAAEHGRQKDENKASKVEGPQPSQKKGAKPVKKSYQNAPHTIPQDMSQGLKHEASYESYEYIEKPHETVLRDKSYDTLTDKSHELLHNKLQEILHDEPQETLHNSPQDIPHDSYEMLHEKLQETVQDNPQEIPHDKQHDKPQEIPHAKPPDAPLAEEKATTSEADDVFLRLEAANDGGGLYLETKSELQLLERAKQESSISKSDDTSGSKSEYVTKSFQSEAIKPGIKSDDSGFTDPSTTMISEFASPHTPDAMPTKTDADLANQIAELQSQLETLKTMAASSRDEPCELKEPERFDSFFKGIEPRSALDRSFLDKNPTDNHSLDKNPTDKSPFDKPKAHESKLEVGRANRRWKNNKDSSSESATNLPAKHSSSPIHLPATFPGHFPETSAKTPPQTADETPTTSSAQEKKSKSGKSKIPKVTCLCYKYISAEANEDDYTPPPLQDLPTNNPFAATSEPLSSEWMKNGCPFPDVCPKKKGRCTEEECATEQCTDENPRPGSFIRDNTQCSPKATEDNKHPLMKYTEDNSMQRTKDGGMQKYDNSSTDRSESSSKSTTDVLKEHQGLPTAGNCKSTKDESKEKCKQLSEKRRSLLEENKHSSTDSLTKDFKEKFLTNKNHPKVVLSTNEEGVKGKSPDGTKKDDERTQECLKQQAQGAPPFSTDANRPTSIDADKNTKTPSTRRGSFLNKESFKLPSSGVRRAHSAKNQQVLSPSASEQNKPSNQGTGNVDDLSPFNKIERSESHTDVLEPLPTPKPRARSISASQPSPYSMPFAHAPGNTAMGQNGLEFDSWRSEGSNPARTYTLEQEGGGGETSRGASPDNTDTQMSGLTDLPEESPTTPAPRNRQTPSLGEDKMTTTYTDSYTTPYSRNTPDFDALSEGEMPFRSLSVAAHHDPSRNTGSVEAKPNGGAPSQQANNRPDVITSATKMEMALAAINEELALCRQLLMKGAHENYQRPQTIESSVNTDAAAMVSRSPIFLRRAAATPNIGDAFSPRCQLTLHIGTVVLSDEAVITSRGLQMMLTWKFFDQNVAMTRLNAGRVMHFDFSTEYDIKLTEDFLDYMKYEEMPIKICEINSPDEPFATGMLPLRDALLHTNKRVDMSLAMVAGPGLVERRQRLGVDLLDASDEVGVLDLWLMLQAEPRALPIINRAIALPWAAARPIEQISDVADELRLSTELHPGTMHNQKQWLADQRASLDQHNSAAPEGVRPRNYNTYNYGYRDTKQPQPQPAEVVPPRSSVDASVREPRDNTSVAGAMVPPTPGMMSLMTGIDGSIAGNEFERREGERRTSMPENGAKGRVSFDGGRARRSSGVVASEVSPNIKTTDAMKKALERGAGNEASRRTSIGRVRDAAYAMHDFITIGDDSAERMEDAAPTKDPGVRRNKKYDAMAKMMKSKKALEAFKRVANKSKLLPQNYGPENKRTSDASDYFEQRPERAISVSVLWLALSEECAVLSDPAVQFLYVAYSFLGRGGADLETPVSLPKPKHYLDKCYFNFHRVFEVSELDIPVLGRMARMRSPSKGLPNPRDCVVFTVVSEPVDDPLGLNNCEDLGNAYMYFGDLLASSGGSDSFSEVLPVHVANTYDVVCGVLAVRVDGLDLVRRCQQVAAPLGPQLRDSLPSTYM